MKIAIVGAGIFGCTSALKLKEKFPKAQVEIFEKNTSILSAASGINQYRLHRGYHYPRSKETVEQVLSGVRAFEEFYPNAVVNSGYERFYAISTRSKVNSDEYCKFLVNNDLKFEIVPKYTLPLWEENIETVLKVEENSFDVGKLYLDIVERLRKTNIKVNYAQKFERKDLQRFDLVINSTYANINELLPSDQHIDYQFELCEKALVSIGREYKNKGIVVVDGEFCCIDPYGSNPYFHVVGHVSEAIHERQVGKIFQVPNGYLKILNIGLVKSSLSRFPFILNGLNEYFKFEGEPVLPESNKGLNKKIGNVHYQGSMFTVRTVLPDREHDDARPSYITKHSDQLYSIFSGKIGTSVEIANELIKQI